MSEYTLEDLVERIRQVDERLGQIEPHAWKEIASAMNFQAVADNLAELRGHYDEDIMSLKNEVNRLKEIVEGQSNMIGVLTQQLWGHGSTTE